MLAFSGASAQAGRGVQRLIFRYQACLTDFALGGLNYQIEHHLFPSMPRPNLHRAQPLVAASCADRDVPYTQTSPLASHAQALGHLAAAGSGLASPASKAVPVPARR